jgi:hypothetical protein
VYLSGSLLLVDGRAQGAPGERGRRHLCRPGSGDCGRRAGYLQGLRIKAARATD